MNRFHKAELTRRAWLGGASALVAALALRPLPAFAASAPWAGTRAMVRGYVASDKLAGAIAAMGLGDAQDVSWIAYGRQSLGFPAPVTPNSLFRIYSMTKPITGMAAMILIDEGKLGLDQPLADILPEYARMQVQRVPDGSIEDLVPAERPITIRQLLTHTAGLGYPIIQKGPIRDAFIAAGLISGQITKLPLTLFARGEPVGSLKLFAERLARMPLVYQPGTRWSYSLGLDLMGRVIEVVSGRPFDAFLKERLFDPLGMTSTFFRVPRAEIERLTSNYGLLGSFMLPIDPARSSIFLEPPPFPFGGSGLVSSPRDYDRFLRMLLGGGKLDGKRVMSEAAVRLGTSNLLPAGVSTRGTLANGGGFGAGGRVGLGREAGTFGWGGAAGTIAFADLQRGWRGGFYTQYMPVDAYPIHSEFPEIAMNDALSILGDTLTEDAA